MNIFLASAPPGYDFLPRAVTIPVPTRPTFIPARTLTADPVRTFEDLDGLCRHVHRLRGRNGLELRASTGSWGGSRTFPVFEVMRLVDDDPEYIGCVFVGALSREGLESALRSAEPRPESHDPALHNPERLLVL